MRRLASGAMIIPTLRYKDAKAAIDFLDRAFGFERQAVHENDDGIVGHAELRLGDGMVMLGTAGHGDTQFDTGRALDLRHRRRTPTRCTSARRPRAPRSRASSQDMDYGSREFARRDPEGNVWSLRDLRPVLAA